MENRWSVRTPLTAQITLYRNKMPVAICPARNIGLGGMFIITGPLTYPRNTPVDIELELERDGETKWYRIPACVVHNARDGLGLMFLEPNAEIKRGIRQIILDDVLNQNSKNHSYDDYFKPRAVM